MVSAPKQALPSWQNVSLRPYTTLKAGGAAEHFMIARTAEEFAEASLAAQRAGRYTTILGFGSNILPSDDGVPGLTLLNLARRIEVSPEGDLVADTGCMFQDLFLRATQAGLSGLEYAVGIPGTLGGALVSNAGAYRSCVSEFITELEVVFEGKRRGVDPAFMEFSYRDSILRRPDPPQCAIVRIRMRLPHGERKQSYDEAREYQRQRISKQPPPASAGSFFKNVNDRPFAESLEGLPLALKQAGVVPAGHLIEACGLKGYRQSGAMFGMRHANFILNVGGASAFAIRDLATLAKKRVRERFGLELEEEVLYLGDWTRYVAAN